MKLIFKTLTFLSISLAVILACLLIVVMVVCSLLFDTSPKLTSFDKANLKDLTRIKALAIEFQQNINASEIKTIALGQRDINLGISHFGPTQIKIPHATYLKVELNQSNGILHVTTPAYELLSTAYKESKQTFTGITLFAFNTLHNFSQDKWVNISLPVSINSSQAREKWINTGELSVGKITLTESISDDIFNTIASQFKNRPDTKQALEAWNNIKHLEISDQKMVIKFVLPQNQNSVLNSYQSIVLSNTEIELIDVYLQIINTLPKHGSLVSVLSALFEHAKQRTKQSADPIAENKAALLALSKIYGGDQLLAMIQSNPMRALKNTPKPYKIYNRRDLAQHFVLSAGLTLIADDSLAELIGIDKEMSDLMGGKTISAWDLLADKAGVRLAENATRSIKLAQKIQIALSRARNDSHILPDLGAEFALSEDRFSADELQELTQLIELLLMKHPLLKK